MGSQDSAKPLGLYSLDDPRQPIHTWFADDKRALRIDDCSISGAGDKLAAITKDNSILLYDLETKLKLGEWLMEDKLTCINLSHDGQTFLVSMNGGRLLLMDAETGEVIQRYTGLKQNDFVIRSSFGGAGENFVISGSEGMHHPEFYYHNNNAYKIDRLACVHLAEAQRHTSRSSGSTQPRYCQLRGLASDQSCHMGVGRG